MKSDELTGYMKFASVIDYKLNIAIRDLVSAAEETQIHTFGWPIGVVIRENEFRPRPTEDGIEAEIAPERDGYDYWTLKSNGEYYILKSLFEHRRSEKPVLFTDTRT